MKRSFISIFFLLYFSIVSGKNQEKIDLSAEVSWKVDSLENLLNISGNDTSRIKLLNQLSWELLEVNPEKALYWVDSAIAISKKMSPRLDTDNEEIRFMLSDENEDFIKKQLARSLYIKGKLQNISMDFESALANFQLSYTLYEELDNKNKMALSLFYVGNVYDNLNEIDKSLFYYKKSYELYKKSGNRKGMALMMSNIGDVMQLKGNFNEAINNYFDCLKIFDDLKDSQHIAMSHNNIAGIYLSLGQIDKSLKFFKKAMKSFESMNDKLGIGICLTNVANIYSAKGQKKKALSAYQRALRLNQEVGDQGGIAACLNNIAIYYYEQGDNEKSLQYLLQAVELNKRLKSFYGIAIAYNNIGELYIEVNELDVAITYLSQSLKLSLKEGYLDLIKYTYSQLAIAYAKKNDYQNAFKYHQEYAKLKDSIFNENSSKQIAEIQTKYETEKKEKEIVLLTKEKEIQDLELNKQTVLRNAFIGGLLLALALAFLLFNRYRIKQKANRQLNEAYNKLKELENFKESMTGMIVHDLKNPLNSIIGFAKQQPDKSTMDIISQSGKQMLNLVMNILDIQKFEDAEVKLDLSSNSVNSVVEDALKQVEVLIKQKGLIIYNHIGQNLQANFDFEIISRVIVNLLTNAIKYTLSGGTITLDASRDKELIKILIADTGLGISPEQLDKVFDKFSQMDAKKSGQTRSTGLGLTFCKMVIEAHGGGDLG
ncbi:tetratricopeptide repeat protein [Bacteroidales bacterium AH-315-N07]|nr:tetratricopeptide repeat protein [Bacteroidales bacterium AH-315-N07]